MDDRSINVSTLDTHRVIDAVWKDRVGQNYRGACANPSRCGLAEELAQDALVAALERWPESGVPDNPGAWLTAVAKHRAIDLLRRNKLVERKHEDLGRELEAEQFMASANFDIDADGDVATTSFGWFLRLVTRCSLPMARIALTLRLLGGLTTDESLAHSWFRSRLSRSGSSAPKGL